MIEGRRYSVAGSWDVNARKGGGAEHTGPDTPIMRRVYSPTKIGPVFWLGKDVPGCNATTFPGFPHKPCPPGGYARFGYKTYLQMDEQTKSDATAYLAALLDQEALSDWGKANERTLYELPDNRNRMMALLRSGGGLPGEPTVGSHMLHSTCELTGVSAQAVRRCL